MLQVANHATDSSWLASGPHITAPLSFVGLNFDPGCLKPGDGAALDRDGERWQVRQAIASGSIGKMAAFEQQLKPFTEALRTGV